MTVAVERHDPYYIVAETRRGTMPETRVAQARRHVRRVRPFGDIAPAAASRGCIHDGTRHLSAASLRVAGQPPLLLSPRPAASSHVLTVDLTNPDIGSANTRSGREGTLHIRRTTFLWEATCYHAREVAQPRP